ncbi:DNA polymerase III subunit delta [Mycoplasma todarodis]|uniref:DNA polymerase III subunit delta n=1 Tax=Mycoplasma todarodis TaxID=1937191 RepID=A0A4R0XNE4_9MOLU|nr:DNA polymerase III subunit delta [Mycoplasma todarodis]TCG11002.1 DNA polymerase III subunit delta [Mycoplasma todarodis]
MYFIYGEESFLINNEEKRIIAKFGIEPVVFDETSNVQELIMELATIPMFEDAKVLVMRDIPAFSKEAEAKKLVEVLKHIDKTTKVIFVNNNAKPKATNTLIKFLMSNATTNKFDKLKNSKVYETIKLIVSSKGGSITNKAAIAFANKVPNDLRVINNEIDKLLLEAKEITIEKIEKSISTYVSEDYFALANAIIEKDAFAIASAYKERTFAGDDPLLLIGQIASTLLLANKVNNYKQTGMTTREISDVTRIHIFRIKKANELLMKTNPIILKQLINDLAKLDIDIKTGVIDSKVGLDKFILNFMK